MLPFSFAYRLLTVSALFLVWNYVVMAAEYNCEITRYATYCEVSNGRLHETDTVILRINNRAGEKYCDIRLYNNRRSPVSGLSAWIEDKNGVVVRYLKNKEITESNYFSSSFYSDDFVMLFTLRHNEYPYYVCYTYQTSYKEFLTVADWRPYIGYDVPTLNACLTLVHPEDFAINILQNHTELQWESSESGIMTRVWKASYDGNLREETFSPPCTDFMPELIVTPQKFLYGLRGSTESWNSFGTWVNSLNEGLDELPESEKKLVLLKISALKNKKEIAGELYHYMQDNTHYIDVNIGLGGLRPYPASYVVQNRYGDCKALTIYMKALLNVAGINSYYVLVHAGSRQEKFYPDFPSQQFNHVILAVPVDGDTLWFENTSQVLPSGYLGSFTQNRTGLLVDENNSRLVKIPALLSGQTVNSSRLDFYLKEERSAALMARYTFRGPSFESYCSLITNYSPDDQNRAIHDLLPFASFDLNAWKIIKTGRDSKIIQLFISLNTQNYTGVIGQEYYFSYQPLIIPEFEPPRIRKLPVQVPYPVTMADTMTYHLPDGRSFTSVPASKSIMSEFGKYESTFIMEGNAVQIIRRFQLNPLTIPMNQYAAFYRFMSSIKTEEKNKILFQ